MTKGRKFTPRHAAKPEKPTDAKAGAPLLRSFMLKMFDREEGRAADWPLIAETLLREAFYALDQVPHDPRAHSILRRVEAGVYDRLAAEPADAFKEGVPASGPAPASDYSGPQHHFSDAPKT